MEQKAGKTVELDVRPHLQKKLEPFQLIMDTVKTLEKDDIFVLHAPFKPTPLLGVLKMKGLVSKSEQIAKDHWIITFVSKKNKHWLNQPSSEPEKSMNTEEFSECQGAVTQEEPNIIELDNRGLEPPQPMMRTLAALDRSQPNDEVIIHNDRVPVFLIEELNSLGYPFTIEEQPDGSAKVRIRKV